MTAQEENQERIEQYLQGKLSPDERAALEAACAADPDLAAKLAEEKAVRRLARAVRILELKDNLQAHLEGSRQGPRPTVKRAVIVMCSVAAVLIVAFFIWMRPPSYKRFALDLMEVSAMRGNGSMEAPLQKAIQFLADDDPKAALPILRLIAQDSTPASDDVLYYIGIAHALETRRDSSQMYLLRYLSIPGGRHRQEALDLMKEF